MMLEYLTLRSALSRVRAFLDGGDEDEMTSDQRVFAYIAAISSIYSIFEGFAEQLAFRFSDLVLGHSGLMSAESKDKLRKRYVHNAALLLSQQLGTGRYKTVTQFDVAQSLTSCLDSTDAFKLRSEVLSFHNANLRMQALVELFSWAVPDLSSRLERSDSVKEWAQSTDHVSDTRLGPVLQSELDELIERRNEVAHRTLPDDILSAERMIAKIDYVEAISRGLAAVLAGAFLEGAKATGLLMELGSVQERFHGGSTIVVNATVELSVGDLLVAMNEESIRWGDIRELQVDDVSSDRVASGREVGVRLDFQCRQTADLFLLKDPPSALTPVPARLFGSSGPLDSEDVG